MVAHDSDKLLLQSYLEVAKASAKSVLQGTMLISSTDWDAWFNIIRDIAK